MQTLEEIEDAVRKLEEQDIDRFRKWFDAFDAARFDNKLESDSRAGKLDGLAKQAVIEFQQGRAREL